MFCTTDDLPREVSAVCRYYITGNCRRGTSCRFVHPPLASIQQDYPYAKGFDAHPRIRWKGWHQNVIHGFTAFPAYTTARPIVGKNFGTSRDVSDNFSDFSSEEDSVAAFDQSLTTAFKVMAINETVPLGPFPCHYPEFSQYHSNTIARYGSVAYPSYYREDIPTNSNARGLSRKSNAVKKKCIAYKTKPCKFFSANKACVQGDKCTFIHDAEKVNRATVGNSQDCEATSSPLPPKPRSLLEDSKARKFYPITWRVIGGGVMMGPPCKAFAAGYCADGVDCKLAHEIKITNDDISRPPSRDGSSCVLLALSTEHKHGGMPTEHSSHTIQDTHGGASDTEVPPCEYQGFSSPGNQSNAKHGVPSRRRTRSMSLPISPLTLRAPYVFAEL